MVIGLVILRFGVANAVNPPSSATRGLFLFASLASGVFTGILCIIFWKGAQHLCAAFGGFAIGMFLLCARSDALIRPLGLRFILLIGLAAASFIASTFEALTTFMTLLSTAALGATAIVLGVDCFTTSNLKEFYIYCVGLGAIFPKLEGHFKQTTAIQIELGVMAGMFFSSLAWQLRLYDALVSKTRELRDADRARQRQDEENGLRSRRITMAGLEEWEEKQRTGASTLSLNVGLLGPHPPDLAGNAPSPTSSEEPATSVFPPLQRNDGTRESPRFSFLPEIDFNTPPSAGRPTSSASALTKVDWPKYFSSRRISSASQAPLTTRRMSAPLVGGIEASRDSDTSNDDETPIGDLATALTQPRPRPAARLSLPTRPSSLALATARPTPPPAAPVASSRHNTFIDLTTNSPSKASARRAQPVAEERIIVGEVRPKVKRVSSTPKIMDYSDLEAKHRKRISQLQAAAVATATADTADTDRNGTKLLGTKTPNSAPRPAAQPRRYSSNMLFETPSSPPPARRFSAHTLPSAPEIGARSNPVSPPVAKSKDSWLGY